jgi:hypothetical protein
MKTRALVKIGYSAVYLAPSADVAAKIVSLLAKCEAVEDVGSEYVELEPDSRQERLYRCELSLVPERMIVRRVPKSRRLKAPEAASSTEDGR